MGWFVIVVSVGFKKDLFQPGRWVPTSDFAASSRQWLIGNCVRKCSFVLCMSGPAESLLMLIDNVVVGSFCMAASPSGLRRRKRSFRRIQFTLCGCRVPAHAPPQAQTGADMYVRYGHVDIAVETVPEAEPVVQRPVSPVVPHAAPPIHCVRPPSSACFPAKTC